AVAEAGLAAVVRAAVLGGHALGGVAAEDARVVAAVLVELALVADGALEALGHAVVVGGALHGQRAVVVIVAAAGAVAAGVAVERDGRLLAGLVALSADGHRVLVGGALAGRVVGDAGLAEEHRVAGLGVDGVERLVARPPRLLVGDRAVVPDGAVGVGAAGL